MKAVYFLIPVFITLSALSGYKEIDPRQYDRNSSSVDGDLISIQKQKLYVLEKNQISTYDLNGNYLQSELSFNRSLYGMFTMHDSIITLIGPDRSLLIKQEANGSYKDVSVNTQVYPFYPKLLYRYNQIYAIFSQSSYSGFAQECSLLEMKNNTLNYSNASVNTHLPAKCISLMHDSTLFILDDKILQLSLKSPQQAPLIHHFDATHEADLFSMHSSGNSLYVSDGLHISLFLSQGNQLQFISKTP